ncbi:MAG: DUF488 family protein, N3 subclade [Solirubrobacterales bacterium]
MAARDAGAELHLDELAEHGEELDALAREARRRRVSLLFAARDERHNDAVVLAEALRRRCSGR